MPVSSTRLRSRLAALRQVQGFGEAILFLHALAFAAAVPLLFRLPLDRLPGALEPRAVRRGDPARAAAVVLAALRLGRPLVRPGCLTRGATLYHFLRRAGSDVSLCFGVGQVPEAGDAPVGHCWLLRGGEPYLEPRDPRPLYVELCRLPGALVPLPR